MNKMINMVCDELRNAKAKHPFFAHKPFLGCYKNEAEGLEQLYGKLLARRIEDKEHSGEDVLKCELAKAKNAHERGDLDHAQQGMAQVAAVAIRIMEMIEAEKGGAK